MHPPFVHMYTYIQHDSIVCLLSTMYLYNTASKTTCTYDRLTTALVSSATVFLITSIASVLIGFLCGRLVCVKNSRPSSLECRHKCSGSHQLSHASTSHVYEAVTSEMITNHFPNQEQKVDLTENVAYEFVQPKTSKSVVTA